MSCQSCRSTRCSECRSTRCTSCSCRPKRTTRNQALAYADCPDRQDHARTAMSRAVRWQSPIAVVRTFTKSSCIKQPLAPQSLSQLHPLHSTSNPPPSKRTRRRRCHRAARRKPPPALMSMPIHRQRTGGTVRGVLARIHRPLGRLGMAPLRSPCGSLVTYKESSESSASRHCLLICMQGKVRLSCHGNRSFMAPFATQRYVLFDCNVSRSATKLPQAGSSVGASSKRTSRWL